jgi:TonB-linked SusC/RagA family outer membrane protein
MSRGHHDINSGCVTIHVQCVGLLAVTMTMVLAAWGSPAQAQGTGAQVVPTGAATEAEVVLNDGMLRRTVALKLEHVHLGDALAVLSERSGVPFLYSPDHVPLDKLVTLVADRITVRDALAVLLQDTGLGFAPWTAGRVRIRPDAQASIARVERQQGGGTIEGRVTDAVTKSPLDQVAVRVEGPGSGAVTTSDGRYTIHKVPSGTYRVTARRVGYTPLTKTVLVAIDSMATVDFALVAAPTRLNEMVTTAVGDQRRYEVGNVISTINADSIAPTAPITSLTDLISSRAPGVTVLETSGMTGSGEAIRIRGLSSLVLQNDPILIVDGVRQDNSAGADLSAFLFAGFSTHPTPTRFNDIDFKDISSIDILKGPSASTEYGTDAANGVIVITTKHGVAGRPRWEASAEQTASGIPVSFPNGYYSWGHLTDGSNVPDDCLLTPSGFSPVSRTTGGCVVDSVTQWNPLNHQATSIFGTGDRGKYDLSVSGGSEAARYFVSGGLTNEAGVIRMPPVFRELADTAHLGLPKSAFNPNSEQQRSVRASTAIRLGATTDLTATASYLSTYQQTPDAEQLYLGVFLGAALSSPAHSYGYDAFSGRGVTPLGELSAIGSQNTDRVTGGLTGTWRPTGWFVGHATVGLDHGSQQDEALNYPLPNPAYQNYTPVLALADATTDVYSVDLRGTATASLTHGLRAVTSGGLQMVDTRIVGQMAAARHITPTNLTLNGATGPIVAQQGTRQATLGGYGEEELSVSDRLFLTGALRIDAGSGFGGAYSTAAYPKASVSWLAINQGATTVRVRGAFGESGVQPTNGAALQLYMPAEATIGGGGSGVTGSQLIWPGNPTLQPERSAELEGGMDIGGWGDRVNLELTGYSKTTHNALVNVNLGGSFGGLTYQENIGEVRNTGIEGSATVGLVQRRSVTWNVTVNASVNHNTLVSLAPNVAAQTLTGVFVQYRQAVGYPLYGLWARRATYTDANRDGIIEPSEVTLADSARFAGSSLPTRDASASTRLGLWRGAVTVSGLVDFRGGYRIANAVGFYADGVGNTRGTNDPTAPLWLQARAVANRVDFNTLDVEDGSFMRVREVAVTYAVPRSLARTLRAQALSVTGAVRNLALWTRYSGVDPEVTNTTGYNVQSAPTTGRSQVNNDVRADFGAVPLARYWLVRLNVGL